jgi:hypothetical protein
VVHSPNRRAHGNLLDAVSCVSPVACTAVGNYASSTGVARTLAESWDGSRWWLVRSPNVGRFGSQLVAVSCVSANACMAVGFTQGGPGATLAESWDGSRWSVLHTPSPGSTGSALYGVSCVLDHLCTAVGAAGNSSGASIPLVEAWDGTRWAVVPTPSPGTTNRTLNGVSCPGTTSCTAAGSYFNGSRNALRTLIETGTASS